MLFRRKTAYHTLAHIQRLILAVQFFDMNIVVIVGSIKKDSLNRRLARALERLAPSEMEFTYVDLHDVPFYNPDHEHEPPTVVANMKARIAAADAVLFASPEYNRSITAVLKNAIEWGTRPPRTNVFAGKPALLVGASPGTLRTAPMQQHLKAVLLHMGMHVMPSPEVYLYGDTDLFSLTGEISDSSVEKFLQLVIDNFTTHVKRFL